MMADLCGQLLGTYRLTRLLGTGGFAQVYLGEHTLSGNLAAIKILHGHLNGFSERFLKEARLLAHLSHPQIIHVLDFGIQDDLSYLVMDYASGGTLRSRHPEETSLPLSTVISYVKQVASPLAYLHEQHIIHRDLKPENLLLGEAGQLLLADFGLAQLLEAGSYLNTSALRGTLAYMPPEQFSSHLAFASDQYALAVMAYEWLAGRRPFLGSAPELCYQHLSIAPPSLRDRLADLPALLEQVLFIALAKAPEHRFPTISLFAQALAIASSGGTETEVLGPLA